MRPIESKLEVVDKFRWRGSVASGVVFRIYVVIVLLVIAGVWADRGPAWSGQWAGFFSAIAVFIAGLPTSWLMMSIVPVSWLRAGGLLLAFAPLAINLLFLGWLAFPRRSALTNEGRRKAVVRKPMPASDLEER